MMNTNLSIKILLIVALESCQGSSAQKQLEAFSAAVPSPASFRCPSYPLLCASSAADRSFSVRSKAQCIHECQHGGERSDCVGVNYREVANVCDVYNQCPASYNGSKEECQYLQREMTADQKNCSVNSVSWDYQTASINLTAPTLPTVTAQSVCGWIVIQQRVPATGASFDWNLGWIDYRTGFGNSDSNYWLGLKFLNHLTTGASYKLRIEVQDNPTGVWYSAEYSTFTVGTASSFYPLDVSGYSGDAGDALQYTGSMNDGGGSNNFYHNGMVFSTYDRDNDPNSSENCAAKLEGGWWFNKCFYACLTCRDSSTQWRTLSSNPLRATRMMMKQN